MITKTRNCTKKSFQFLGYPSRINRRINDCATCYTLLRSVTVDRIHIWTKLLNCDIITGKIFNVVHNLYAKAKSRVFSNGKMSDIFPCQIGVRQCDRLSPLLFALYLSDLNSFLSEFCEGLKLVPALAS